MDPRDTLEQRLRELDWSNGELARRSGQPSDTGSIGKFLSGKKNPSFTTYARWIEAMGGSLEIIFSEEAPEA